MAIFYYKNTVKIALKFQRSKHGESGTYARFDSILNCGYTKKSFERRNNFIIRLCFCKEEFYQINITVENFLSSSVSEKIVCDARKTTHTQTQTYCVVENRIIFLRIDLNKKILCGTKKNCPRVSVEES